MQSSDFQLAFLPLRTPIREHKTLYAQAASTWELVWQKVNQNFKVESPLFLDAFLRQDEAACLFTPEGCAGMILFRTIDFSIMNYRKDSYFKEWTDFDLAKLLQHGQKAFLSNYLSVHPDYRGAHLKEVFLDLMVMRFQESGADVISGITRRDRSINDISFDLGATLVRENVDFFGGREKVDLVAFYRSNVRRSPVEKIKKFSDEVWSRKLDLIRAPRPSLKAA